MFSGCRRIKETKSKPAVFLHSVILAKKTLGNKAKKWLLGELWVNFLALVAVAARPQCHLKDGQISFKRTYNAKA
jgi:hypothetical protein